MQISSVISKIGGYASKFSGKPLEYTSKILGAATIASVIYDSHVNGKEKAIVKDRIETAERYEENYRQYMLLNKKSQTLADCKNFWFNMQKTFSMLHIFSRVSGYITGAVKTILSNLPEIGLSILALKTKNHKILGKLSGIALSINAMKSFFYDVIGIGKSKD